MLENFPDILTVAQLQEALSIGRSKAYSLLREGKLPYLRIGRQVRIPKKYLLDFLSDASYNGGMKSGADCLKGRAL